MILLALGSNRGDREAYLAQARTVLTVYDITITAQSGIHETPALMPPGAPKDWNMPYLNQVLVVETHLAPRELLTAIKLIEAELGRTPEARWAPREIDIDLLAYADVVMVDESLTLPHPQMDARAFVLAPLCEIAPDWRHPVLGRSARELLAQLPA